MRIPSGTTNQVKGFVAVDPTDKATREPGLTGFTVNRVRNGGTPTAMTTPTVTEISATLFPGVYNLLMDEDMTIGAGNDNEEMLFHITHASMEPVTIAIELYRPKVTVGNTLDVTATGAAGIDWGNVENSTTSVDLSATSINLCDTVTTNTDMRGTDSALLAASAPTNFGDLSITATTGLVDVSDKTGYSISGTITTLDGLNNVAATDIVSAGAITTLTGAVVNVDLVDTCTTNTDMRGTDSAALASVCTEARLAELDAANLPADVTAILADTGTDGVAISATTANQIADAILNRDMSAVSDTTARSMLNALRFLRNKWSISGTTLTVTKEDDTTAAWTATVSTDAAADPVTGNDPA